MRRIKFLVLASLAMLLLFGIPANAQTTVKSISAEKKYTDKQIQSILGTPDRLVKQEGDDGEALCNYYYQDAKFFFSDGQLIWMCIETKKYPVMTDRISGGIKVGDNISKVLKIKGVRYSQSDDDKSCYFISFNKYNEPDYSIWTKNGIITVIGYTLLD